jgi:CRP/FNR family transcriptional regulator
MVTVGMLATVPWLSAIRKPALELVAARAVELRFPKGRVLYTAGTIPAGLLVILEGRVRVLRGRGGRQHVVHEEGVGGTLGEIPVFSGGSYPATAVAAELTRCAMLPTEALKAATRTDPDLAFVLLRRMAERTRGLVDRVDRLAGQAVKGRLAVQLLERHRTADSDGGFSLGRTQLQVAEELGTVREVLVRALRELREDGLLEHLSRGRYRLVDIARLRTLAG